MRSTLWILVVDNLKLKLHSSSQIRWLKTYAISHCNRRVNFPEKSFDSNIKYYEFNVLCNKMKSKIIVFFFSEPLCEISSIANSGCRVISFFRSSLSQFSSRKLSLYSDDILIKLTFAFSPLASRGDLRPSTEPYDQTLKCIALFFSAFSSSYNNNLKQLFACFSFYQIQHMFRWVYFGKQKELDVWSLV